MESMIQAALLIRYAFINSCPYHIVRLVGARIMILFPLMQQQAQHFFNITTSQSLHAKRRPARV